MNTRAYKISEGMSEKKVRELSHIKAEPKWMLEKRLEAYRALKSIQFPSWAPDAARMNFKDIILYSKSFDAIAEKWEELPKNIRSTYEQLGIPETEQRFFAGFGAQYDSEIVYHRIQKELSEQGVIFCGTDTAVKKYPELLKQYFGTVVTSNENISTAINGAFWSGGSFVYIPKGVLVSIPLQSYFWIQTRRAGQFERTLIIAEEGSSVHYIEGCTAPVHSDNALHAAVVEIIAKPRARVRYTTMQNWSKNVYNLVTKRGVCEEEASIEWVDGNIGSRVSMKYPTVKLLGRKSKANLLSVSLSGKDQLQDTGSRVIHIGSETVSNMVSKSLSLSNGVNTYRGMVRVEKGATNARASVSCSGFLFHKRAVLNSYPFLDIQEKTSRIEHEASVSRLAEKELLYWRSRGFSESEAKSALASSFVEEFTRELPGDYAIEFNRLIELEMRDAIG